MLTELIANSMDVLRGKLARHKYQYGPWAEVARAINAYHNNEASYAIKGDLLARFMKGQQIHMRRLAKIEAWCSAQEKSVTTCL